jgi:hypothetical protein
VSVRIPASGASTTLKIRVRNDFAVSYESTLPALGSPTVGLRIISETWSASRDTFTLNVAGTPGASYDLSVWNPGQTASVEGGELFGGRRDTAKVRVQFPLSASPADATNKIVFHFSTNNSALGHNIPTDLMPHIAALPESSADKSAQVSNLYHGGT